MVASISRKVNNSPDSSRSHDEWFQGQSVDFLQETDAWTQSGWNPLSSAGFCLDRHPWPARWAGTDQRPSELH